MASPTQRFVRLLVRLAPVPGSTKRLARLTQWVKGPQPSPIDRVIAQREAVIVYQPIVDLRTARVFGYEALARTQAPEFNGPLALFEAAVAKGVTGRLGRMLREMAIEGCPDWPLFLNVNPNEFNEGFLVQPDDPFSTHQPVYLEITESVPLSHFQFCHTVLGEIREKGVFLAVDDLGAGFSNLVYISDLAPEVVKLDRELIQGLALESRKQKLVRSIVRLCEDMGARVVAEGIETADELRAILDTGAHFGQGYLLGRPGFPLKDVTWPESIPRPGR